MPEHLDFLDEHRRREVPVTLHLPPEARPGNAVPVVVFSTGFGGGRDGYPALAGSWAQHGFAVAVLEHEGSGRKALQDLNEVPRAERTAALEARVRDPHERRERPRDVSFVLDRLSQDARLDTSRVGVGGHSFGAYTALAIGGVPVDGEILEDVRAAAILALSPPVPGHLLEAGDHSRLELPTLLVTGTRDHGPFLDSPAVDRTRVLEALTGAPRALALFEGADHMTFAEMGLRYKAFQKPVQALTLQFWRAALLGEPWPDEDWVREHVGGPELLGFSRRSPGPSPAPRG